VYTGNVRDLEGGTTVCPSCREVCIARDGYQILDYRLDASGRCKRCGVAVAGRYAEEVDSFDGRRIPVVIG